MSTGFWEGLHPGWLSTLAYSNNRDVPHGKATGCVLRSITDNPPTVLQHITALWDLDLDLPGVIITSRFIIYVSLL